MGMTSIQFQLLLCNCKPISLLHGQSLVEDEQHQHLNQLPSSISTSISSRRQMMSTAAMLFSGGFCFQGVDVVAAAEQPEGHLPSHHGLHIANLLHAAADHHTTELSMPPHKGSSGRASRPRRLFDTRAESMCWAKAETVPGRDPDRWRKDTAGNIVFKGFHNCQGCLCFQYDHIVPYSRGGLSVVENCQILQTRVNHLKSDKKDIITNQLKGYSCDISFKDYQLDIIEISFYGNIIRPGRNVQCRVRSVDESRGNHKSEQIHDCKLP